MKMPFVTRGFVFEVANRFSFAFKLVFAPSTDVIEPAPLKMSRPTLGEVPTSVFRMTKVASV